MRESVRFALDGGSKAQLVHAHLEHADRFRARRTFEGRPGAGGSLITSGGGSPGAGGGKGGSRRGGSLGPGSRAGGFGGSGSLAGGFLCGSRMGWRGRSGDGGSFVVIALRAGVLLS